MGNTFEIWSWLVIPEHKQGCFEWRQQWAGEDEAEALAELRRLKATGNHPCVKLIWR